MNYYRACHYNKLLKVHRQKGQVYYFPLRHWDGWSKWLSEVGEFHTFFEYVLYFVPFCTKQPFLPSVSFFFGEEANGREWTERQGEKKCHLLVSECFFHSSNSSLPAACLCFPFLLKCTKPSPPSHSASLTNVQVTLKKQLSWLIIRS